MLSGLAPSEGGGALTYRRNRVTADCATLDAGTRLKQIFATSLIGAPASAADQNVMSPLRIGTKRRCFSPAKRLIPRC